jgi:hypothetical protein
MAAIHTSPISKKIYKSLDILQKMIIMNFMSKDSSEEKYRNMEEKWEGRM